nr:MAG TPA_asm: Replicase polyprotein 1ab, FCoV, nsp4, VIRAL PROTEIN [Caudoviricetes sp.]DAZ65719.1 MAG TPA: Replicase polyprotein 1ab, FCoV, nsp4, VIRAL PROTEIN [Caudoviricetes sp.]
MGDVLTSHGGRFDDHMGDKKTSHGGQNVLTCPPTCAILFSDH